MGDEGWGGGGLFFSTDPKCLWIETPYGHKVSEDFSFFFDCEGWSSKFRLQNWPAAELNF